MPEGVLMPGQDIFSMNLQGMKKVMDINLWGSVIPTQVFGDAIAKNGKGSIVNISSMNSKRAITRVLGYNMGKAALPVLRTPYLVAEGAPTPTDCAPHLQNRHPHRGGAGSGLR